MNYIITTKKSAQEVCWNEIPALAVNQYNWGGEYRPKVTAKVVCVQDTGLLIRMDCEETNPRAVHTEENAMVCQDSCLECFFDFVPKAGKGYINFEMNANGVLHAALGKDRHERTYLTDMNFQNPAVVIEQTATSWAVELMVSFELIESIYGASPKKSGDSFQGNFYKCGDLTDTPHYGSWNAIGSENPDFHLSQYFGTLTIQ